MKGNYPSGGSCSRGHPVSGHCDTQVGTHMVFTAAPKSCIEGGADGEVQKTHRKHVMTRAEVQDNRTFSVSFCFLCA